MELGPRLIAFYERPRIRVASEGFHNPGFHLSTLFCGPAELSLWRREKPKWYVRIPARILAAHRGG